MLNRSRLWRRAAMVLWLAAASAQFSGCALVPKAVPLTEQAAPQPFTLASNQGPLSSSDALARGPLVVLFYRGHF